MNGALSQPKLHILTALGVGACLYLFLTFEVVADAGVLAIALQLVVSVAFSIIVVGLSALARCLLRIPALGRLWCSSVIPSAVVLAAAILLFIFGRSLGFTVTYTSVDTGVSFQTLHPAVAYGSLFAAVFATLHFCTGRAPIAPEREA